MRTISYKLDDLKKVVIPIGYEGENNHTRVIIDAGEVFKQYPEAVVALTVQPPKGTMYPAIVTRDGDTVTWDVKDSDCASNGNGEAQFTFTNSTVVVKSVVTKIKVQRSLHTEGPAPDPIQNWLDTASETLEEADQAIEAATDAAAAAAAAVEDLEALDDITKAALAGDVGKALSPKTVENGVVTEWQFVEPGAGTDDYADLDNKPSIAGVTLSGNKTLEDLGIAADDDLDNLAGEVSDVKTAIQGITPNAQQSDIGKALILKTIDQTGKPTAFEYGEAGGGSVDPSVVEQKVDEWLEENILNPDSPPLDRSLSSSSAAAPADIVGDVEKKQGHTVLAGTYSGTRYTSVDKTIAPGKYHIHIDSVASTDTDKTVCRFAFLNSSSQDVLVELFNRNVAIDIDITIPSEVAKVAMYASSVYAYGANDTFSFTGLVISERYDLLDTVNGLASKAPVFDNYDIKTLKVFDSFTPNHYSFTFIEGATIQNYASYATESSTYYNTKPIKIRNSDGSLIYKNLHVTSKDAQTNCAWTFDSNGAFLRAVTFATMASRETPFLSDEFYVILNEFPTTVGYTDIHWYVSNIDIGWLNGKNEYIVGDGGDFATFTAMLIALANDKREKTVYVKGGTYDIFDEMGGAEYIATVAPSASELNWRDVCHVVPPNTSIIGMGNVVLSWQPTAQQMVNETTAFLFSPLNVSGTCHIENITVVAKNCRYVVHDETNGLPEFDGAKRCFKNCKFTLLEGSYGFICYGAGHNKLMDVRFEDCVIESENSSLIWSTHDWATEANNNSVFVINNCIFTSTKSDPNVRFSTNDTVGKLDKVTFNNCYLEKVKFVTTSGADAKQGYDVQLIGCSPVTVEYDEHVTDRVAVRQYNPIPQST